jgi:hypothetical protein
MITKLKQQLNAALLLKIKIGLEQSQMGKVHTTKEARAKLARWLLK